jgi:hypothetical protein
VELAGRSRGTSSVWLAASEARAWAVLGNGTAAKAALERAVTARERVVPDELDEFGGLLTFGIPRQLYYAADTTVWLPGEEERAEREATDALSAYERGEATERSFGDEAGARADLALARANRGELDGARDALARVLDLAPSQRIGGVVKAAMRVHNALRLPRYGDSAAARGIQSDIEEFCQVPATLTLP